jgi:anti-anti-sigma factor
LNDVPLDTSYYELSGRHSTREIAVPENRVHFLSARPPIRVDRSSHGDFAALVQLAGEHDLSTAPQLSETIRAIRGNVLVDLSECSFIDSSVIGALLMADRDRAPDGHRVELAVAPENATIHRIVEVTGLADLLPVRFGRRA